MTELRNYILSKLQEMAKAPKKKVEPKKPVKTEPSHEDQEDFAKWQDEHNPMSNVQQESTDSSGKPAPRRKPTSKSAEAAREAAKKSKFSEIFARINAGPGAPPPKQPKPENSSTDLRTQLMYILADKLDEVINPSFKVDKEEVEARKTRGMKPFPTTNKPTPNRAELMRDAAKAAADAVKNPKPMPSITNTDVSQYLPKNREDSSTNLKDRMVKILFEAFTGTTALNMEYHGRKEGKPWATGSRANMLKSSRTLSSIVNNQKSVQQAREKAKAEAAVNPKPASGGHKPRQPKRTQSGSYFRHHSGKDVEI